MAKTAIYYVDYDGGTSVPVRASSFEHAASIIVRRNRKLWPEGKMYVRTEKEFVVGEVKENA